MPFGKATWFIPTLTRQPQRQAGSAHRLAFGVYCQARETASAT